MERTIKELLINPGTIRPPRCSQRLIKQDFVQEVYEVEQDTNSRRPLACLG